MGSIILPPLVAWAIVTVLFVLLVVGWVVGWVVLLLWPVGLVRWGGSKVAARASNRANAEGLGLGPEREVKRFAGMPGLASPCPCALDFPFFCRRACRSA